MTNWSQNIASQNESPAALTQFQRWNWACIDLDIAPQFRTYTGDSPYAFVVSLNLARRHLTPSQIGGISPEVMPLLEAEANLRRIALSGSWADEVVEFLPPPEQGKARDIAAKMLGVNPRYIQDAKTIQKHAPELLDDIRAGTAENRPRR